MKYLIVGGNATGMSAASRLRRNLPEAEITVLEKGGLVSFGGCGLPYFVGGEFSDPAEMIARPLEAFQKSNIDVRLFHEALRLDAAQKTVGARNLQTGEELTFTFDRLLISTGAAPIVPNLPGVGLEGVFTLTKMQDGIALKAALAQARRVVIVGAGFIGLETAEAMLHQGKEVTLIEMEDRPSGKTFDPEITALLEKSLVKGGVNLRLREKLVAIHGAGQASSVQTDKNTYEADLVVLALGFKPQSSWCEGLDKLPNGAIKIDSQGKTNLENIFSGGDCASIIHAVTGKAHYIPLATGANKMGRVLGDILADKRAEYPGSLGSAGLRFMDFEAGRTGLSAWEAQALGYTFTQHNITDFNHTSYVPGRSELLIKLIYDSKSRVILGGQICGQRDAVLRTDALAVAIFKKMTVDELGLLDFIYAPPFARTWEALNIAGNTAK